jgi:hypothetical protein
MEKDIKPQNIVESEDTFRDYAESHFGANQKAMLKEFDKLSRGQDIHLVYELTPGLFYDNGSLAVSYHSILSNPIPETERQIASISPEGIRLSYSFDRRRKNYTVMPNGDVDIIDGRSERVSIEDIIEELSEEPELNVTEQTILDSLERVKTAIRQ